LELNELLHFLAEEREFDLRGYKATTLERRIRKRMAQLSHSTYGEYIEYIREHPSETNQLLNTILINVTEFFRDPAAWDVMAQDVLPHMLKRLRTGDSFRAWVAGCSTGEEVYSLAILIAEYFGPRLPEFDIKIYATDADDNALGIARRGEYEPERLRRVRPEWVEKYFFGATLLRVNREVRRMVIFGRSDLAKDAPISHVQLVVCRNVLIYFDSITQTHILNRFHYALDPGGILFLGKSESKLTNSASFLPLDSRWRIFRKDGLDTSRAPILKPSRDHERMSGNDVPRQDELVRLSLYHRALLEVLEPGVFSLDANDTFVSENKSALELWGVSGKKMVGQSLAGSPLAARCPEMMRHLEQSHRNPGKQVRFECSIQIGEEQRTLQVSIRPVNAEDGEQQRVGTLICAEDITHREKLQTTIEQLEATGEELQSANEELETTNEELQSTNEELETTNEELQSTNEELETTNEELQSLNEELENMNEELEFRTRELDTLNSRYAETLERMPWAVTVLDAEGRVQFWNSAAQKLFDLEAGSVIGLELSQLPIQPAVREALIRRRRIVIEKQTPMQLRNQQFEFRRSKQTFDIHLTPLSREGDKPSLLLMFAPHQPETPMKAEGNSRNSRSSSKAAKKKVSANGSRRK
jgi:two-component system CheB/CheR fusion protein